MAIFETLNFDIFFAIVSVYEEFYTKSKIIIMNMANAHDAENILA